MTRTRRLDAWSWLALVIGVGSIANALWMLVGPMHWYTDLPAKVPDTGPFNPHFVRDVGCAFLAVGVALVWAAFSPGRRLALIAVATCFLTAHALLHAVDTLRGELPADHWWLDLPGVYLPALVLVVATWVLARRESDAHPR